MHARARSLTAFALAVALPLARAAASPILHHDEAAPRLSRSPESVREAVVAARALLESARISQSHEVAEQALALVRAAAEVAPEDAAVLATLAYAQASLHRFEEALLTAARAAALAPDDPATQAVITDACVELGRYEEAVLACERLMELKPGPAAYARASYLRSLHGDRAGALELMELARDATGDAAGRAWCDVHLGDEHLLAGAAAEALASYRAALERLPDYRLAELGLARAHEALGDAAAAREVLENVLERDSADADAHAQLARLCGDAGDAAGAVLHYDRAEELERAELAHDSTDTHHLARLLLDRGDRAAEALELARAAATKRRDIASCDLLTQAALAGGDLEEARRSARLSLRTGTDDPRILCHAGLAFAALADALSARSLLDRALAVEHVLSSADRAAARRARAAL